MVKGIEIDGTVVEEFRGSRFCVVLDSGLRVTCYAGGRLRKNRIQIVVGDRVRCELGEADPNLGRIIYRDR